jgi:hypothetical protein
MRPAETLVDAEGCQYLSQRVALHGGAAVGVHHEAGLDAVAGSGFGEKLGRQMLALLRNRCIAPTLAPITEAFDRACASGTRLSSVRN